MVRFGNRETFAVEVADHESPDFCHINVWAGGRRLTVDDDVERPWTAAGLIRHDVERVRCGALQPHPAPGKSPEETYRRIHADDTEWREGFWLLHWGAILDNVTSYAYTEADELVIVFAFWRKSHSGPEVVGEPYVARVGIERFANDAFAAATHLSNQPRSS